jgi:hypothetical protein
LRGFGALFEAHEHHHLGAKHLTVELDRFLAAAFEEQVGLDLQCYVSFGLGVKDQTQNGL